MNIYQGRKWNFRDIFSLVPYLLLGDTAKFKDAKGNNTDPCIWAAEMYKKI